MKKTIKDLILQIIPVMIGVYLGFLVSNWSGNKKSKLQTEQLKESILSELEINAKNIKQVQNYHVMLRDSTRKISNGDITSNLNFFEGIKMSSLTHSAFTSGMQTGVINNLSLEEIQLLNEYYTFQDDYNQFGKMTLEGLVNKNLGSKDIIPEIANFLSLTMTDVVIMEENLLKGIEKIKIKLNRK